MVDFTEVLTLWMVNFTDGLLYGWLLLLLGIVFIQMVDFSEVLTL